MNKAETFVKKKTNKQNKKQKRTKKLKEKFTDNVDTKRNKDD